MQRFVPVTFYPMDPDPTGLDQLKNYIKHKLETVYFL